ncbi:hypothetical protein PEDI_05990 [Persicobacter diffluens]|uniref:Uncharacterized protein n=1 Tax=Persicobacter diffluens TaxID=981 RepID=A0AAN4VW48_9BACT|nr:hypothetical protein PEDI_05990 [Persicobacter diffluens]
MLFSKGELEDDLVPKSGLRPNFHLKLFPSSRSEKKGGALTFFMKMK